MNGQTEGDIVTDEQYSDFDLTLEWKATPGVNSGVMYRVSEAKNVPYRTGPEYQILDDPWYKDEKNFKGIKPVQLTGAAFGLYAPTKDVTRPVGEWNQTRIVVSGNHVEHWLNGEKIVEYELGTADWNKRVAASPFGKEDRFGKEKKGHIDLQWLTNEVAFRNIKIKELPTVKPDNDGFVPLFNGKDTKGWKTHSSQRGNWRVVNGILTGSGSGAQVDVQSLVHGARRLQGLHSTPRYAAHGRGH